MDAGTKAIKISRLSLSLGGSRILRDVSFDVERGECLCVIGRNGAGKSTLFKCVAGVHKNYAGELYIDGHPAPELNARERARHIAYVPQSTPADIPYTAEEFVEMARYPWRNLSSDANDRRAVADAMTLTGTTSLASRKLASLSGGERQKVMIASAIAQGTGTILMDEPTTFLDYAHQVETIKVISRVNKERGVTLMMVTHDVNLAIGMTGKIVAMSDGRVEWTGDPGRLLEPGRLSGIFGVGFRQYSSGAPGEIPMLAPENNI